MPPRRYPSPSETAPAGGRPSLLEGLVVASHGRHVMVESPDGSRRICHPRGKKSACVVGDRVKWQPSADEGSIEAVLPRRNLFFRQDELRTKSFAANLDQVLVLVAAEPEFSESQLARALIAARSQHIPAVIGLNKRDLTVPFERASRRLEPYRRMGETVVPLALRHDAEDDRQRLLGLLQGRTTLVLGPSGAGKSTLANLLVPDADALTQEISTALNSGRHTTTTTTWYWLDASRQSALIDSPGFQEFGLRQIEPMQLPALMPDIAAHAQACRFYNCTHLHEPGCGVLAAVGDAISPSRHRIYAELFDELGQAPRY